MIRSLALFALLAAPLQAQDSLPPRIWYAAGDIADCDPDLAADEATGRLINAAIAQDSTIRVAALGDLVYPNPVNLACYTASWGRFKELTRPVEGNHEKYAGGESKYYDYWNGVGVDSGKAGHRDRGWYALKRDNWTLYFMNSEYEAGSGSTTATRLRAGAQVQADWMRARALVDPTPCQAMFTHRVLFSSGESGVSGYMRTLYDAFYSIRGDVALGGHVHKWEGTKRINPDGTVDSLGFRQFVLGIGGKLESWPWDTIKPYSIFHGEGPGVGRLTLRSADYSVEVLDTNGVVLASQGGACR